MRTNQQPVRIALFAPDGRMGIAIQQAIAENSDFELANDQGDVLIDFSAPDALRSSLDRAITAGVPLLIGTTGLIDEHEALIADAAKIIPILRAPNTSLGVALISDLTERAARVLGPDWDIEIVEAHHNRKADAPRALHCTSERQRIVAEVADRLRNADAMARDCNGKRVQSAIPLYVVERLLVTMT
jgi:4-hydroxy-tetrahydrodipicolinate reductase